MSMSTKLRRRLNRSGPVAGVADLGDRLSLLAASGAYVGHDAGFGSVFYVDSNGPTGVRDGTSWDRALETIDEAIAFCTASKGDVIYVAPGHAETIASATGLVLDIAGVKIIGLGSGALQPTLTLSAAASTVSITAADVAIANIGLLSSFTTGVTASMTVAATADGLTLDGIVWKETTNAKEWLSGINIAALCTDVTIQNCRYFGTAGGNTDEFIDCAGACDRFKFVDNYVQVDAAVAIIALEVAASVDVEIGHNRLINVDAAVGEGIILHASSTGFAYENYVCNLDGNGVAGITGAGMSFSENYMSNALNKSGLLLPAVDS